MPNLTAGDQLETKVVDEISSVEINSMDNDVLNRLIESVRREKEDLSSSMDHKDHNSHSSTAQ